MSRINLLREIFVDRTGLRFTRFWVWGFCQKKLGRISGRKMFAKWEKDALDFSEH